MIPDIKRTIEIREAMELETPVYDEEIERIVRHLLEERDRR